MKSAKPRGDQAPVLDQYGRLLSAQDAAAALGMAVPMLRRLVASGEITALRHTNGRLIGVYEYHLKEWQCAHLVVLPSSIARERGVRNVDLEMRKLIQGKPYFPF